MALKGKTAQDRADWEKKYSREIQGLTPEQVDEVFTRFNFRKKYGNTGNGKSAAELEEIWNKDYDDSIASIQTSTLDPISVDTTQQSDVTAIAAPTIEPIRTIGDNEEKEVEDIFKENSDVFKQRLSYYDDRYERNAFAAKDAVQSIKEVANVASPYYRKFNGTDYIQFDNADWSNIAKQYMAYQDAYGEEQAVEYLRKTIYDEVDRNTSWLEDQWTGFKGMGLSAIQDLGVLFTALPTGVYEYAKGEHEIEGANGFTEFIDAVVDNKMTRYFNDAKQWGTLDPERQRRNKELGISDLQIMDDYDVMTGDAGLLEQMFNKNTLAHLTDQYGFTLASLFMGGLARKLTSKMFKGIKGASYARNMQKTDKALSDVKKTLNAWQRVENAVDRILIPGFIGQGEGVIEALQTKQTIMEDGKPAVDQRFQSEVEQTFQTLYNENYQKMFDELTKPKTLTMHNDEQGIHGEVTGGGMTPEEANNYIVNALWDQAEAMHAEQYQETLDQLDYVAARGARNNFLMNSAINGLLNSTLKASLFGNKVLGRLQTSRLGKLFSSNPKIEVNAAGKATGKLPTWKAAYIIGRESMGEGLEEGAQYISDKREQGRASNNLGLFLDYKYGALPGQADINVGHIFWEDYAAANLAGLEAFADKELYLNMYYGMASSILGGVAMPQRAQTADGKKGKYFQYGVNAKGEKEKWYDVARRLAPWRSGISQGIERTKAINAELQNEAEAMQAWLDDPQNRAKFDGTNGTLRWARAMQENAEAGDEFGFRNTSKGKAINDAIMLQKLRGTEFYNTFMQNVEIARHLTVNSQEAKVFIKEFRENLGNNSENMSDEEIVEQVRNNANTMMSEYEKVQEEGDKLERLLGQIDDDTKESLIYGQMMIDDFQERRNQIESDLRAIKIEPIEVEPAKHGDAVEVLKSEDEIMHMSPVERAQFLTSESQKHSAEQQKIIDNVIAQGVSQDGDFLGKIKDAGRLQAAQIGYMQDYAKVLIDPDNFGKYYAYNSKINGIRAMYAKKYETLQEIEDYDTFAREMDKLITEGTVYERNTILKQMEKDASVQSEEGTESKFARYKRSRQEIADIIKQASTEGQLNNLNGQAIHEFINAVSYLTHKGVDIHNGDAVTNALLEADDSGNNLFREYSNTVAPYTPSSPSEEITVMSPEEIITLVHDIVASYDKGVAEQVWKTSPVEVKIDAQQAAGPSESPKVYPGVFASASRTQEENDAELQKHGEGTVTEGTTITETGATRVVTQEEKQEATISEESIAHNFIDTNSVSIAKAAQKIEQYINASTLLEEEKKTALDVLNRLSDDAYESVEDLINSFNAEANKLDIQGDTNTAVMMRKIAAKVAIEAKEEAAKTQAQKREQTNKIKELTNISPLAQKVLSFSNEKDIRDSSNMQTLQIGGDGGLKSRFSTDSSAPNYSPLLRYIKEHKVEEFLSNNDITRDEPVYFVCDPVLAQEQQNVWKEHGYNNYSSANLPVIAVVKSDKGTVEIGGEKYQPIGIMPSTGGKNYYGSNRLDKVRAHISENADAPFLISDSKGVIETRLSNHLYAQVPNQLKRNITYMEAFLNNLYAEDRKQWNDTPAANRKGLASYKAAKAQFLARLRKVELRRKNSDQTRPALILETPNYKDDPVPFETFFPDVMNTKGVTMDKSVGEMLKDGDTSLMAINSRLRRWGRELSKFASNLDDSEIITSPDGEVSESSARLLSSMSEQLDSKLSNFLRVPGYSIKLEAGPVVGDNRQFIVTYTDGTNTFTIGTIQKGALTEEQQFTLAKNLILDAQGNARTTYDGRALVKWHVSFEDAANINSSDVARSNISEIFDDGIFEISKKMASYPLTSITLEAPYTMEGARMTFKSKVVTNQDNATVTPAAPIASEQVTQGSVTIDAATGTVIDGELPSSTNQAMEAAAEKAKEIEQEGHSQNDTDKYQKFGQEYTNPLVEDVESPEETIKQQALDLFRKLAFGSSLTGGDIIHNLLNITEKALSNFDTQVQAWKSRLVADGITLLDKEILATWQTEGNRFGIPVNLAYDARGQWKVYVPVIGEHTTVDEQMTKMFVDSIEKEYGIKIHDFNFVELSVQMPKGNNIKVENGQVITNNSHRYDGSRPVISRVTTTQSSDITTYAQAVQSISSKIAVEPSDIDTAPEISDDSQWNDGLFGGKQGEEVGLGEGMYIPASQQWGVFAGRNLNVAKTVANLEANGITEEDWLFMTEPEREHELECKGVY